MSTTRSALRLVIPTLGERPTLGAGCCAMPAGDVLVEALLELPGIEGVVVDEHDGALRVTVSEPNAPILTEASDLLAAYGYPVQEVQRGW